MAKKSDAARTFNVAVLGLSGTEKEKGQLGVGKSCLCNRFVRSDADDYHVDHISVLSQTDFSGRVVNNDHFLYWGETTKSSEEGFELHFQVIEQTEFIDDSSFQPFKGGKMEAYVKRCSATKLTSAEKLMYICKNQLGIEKEYEQKVLPDGKIVIDGFICVFDVSVVPSRSVEKQVDFVANILNNLMKTKKPVVLVTTKNDESHELYVKEAERLVTRKEYKGSIQIIETSAHEDVNVDLAFITLVQVIDRTKGRIKIVPFADAAREKKDLLDLVTDAFHRVIWTQVTDYRTTWSITSKILAQNQDYIRYCKLFGRDSAQKLFRRYVRKLKDEYLSKKIQGYMAGLPEILQQMFPDFTSLGDRDWVAVQQKIHEHPDFDKYFVEFSEDMSWTEMDTIDTSESRIPFDVLDTTEAETVYKNHCNALQAEQKRLELRKEFKHLLEDTGYVTPGKSLTEVRVLFMGRECFETLAEQDCKEVYEQHQKEIIEKAKHNFRELLLEHANLFYQFKSIAPAETITQDDIKEITDALQDDYRYKALDRLDQDRKLMLLKHLGFVHCPIRAHCPAFPNCMDVIIERLIENKAHRPSSWNRNSQWLLNSDNSQLNLVLLGIDGLADALANEIRSQCDEDEYELENQLYTLDYRIIDGDVSLPQNSFRTADFLPHGCFCVYANPESFEYVRESLEKTLLSNLEQDDRLPFQGLPIVILFAADSSLGEKDVISLKEDGQSLADSLQCPFIDVSTEELVSDQQFNSAVVAEALQSLIKSIQHRAGVLNIYQSLSEATEPDIRIIMCMLCGDPYSVENVLGPLLSHQCCFLSGDCSITLETFLGDSKRKVEVIISSYHGANAFRDELVHGFILVYSTKRKASLATLSAFSFNIPNLPIQILAVTDTGGANAFFSNDLSHQLITEGNAIADRLQAHFMTSTSTCQQKTAFYTPFFKEVYEKKPEIEQAFHMEDPAQLDDSGEGTLERPPHHPLPPPRRESYHVHGGSNDGSGSEIYERLPTDGSLGDELDEPLSPTYPDDRPLSPSDDSDIYSTVDNTYSQENGEHLVKPSQIKSRRKLQQGWVDDSVFLRRPDRNEEMWMSPYQQHAFTTGRQRRGPPPTKPRPKGGCQTLKQPGKLNMKEFSTVTDAIARMNVSGKDPKSSAPLATPENVDICTDYPQGKDAVHSYGSYSYTLVPDIVHSSKARFRQRREKGRPSKLKMDHSCGVTFEDESSHEVSSPRDRDVNSPVFGVIAKVKDSSDKTSRRKEKLKSKDDEKQERRKQKEEEKQKKIAEKDKEKEKRKKKVKSGSLAQPAGLEDLIQSEDNPVPLFLEKSVKFIEEEGLDSEGIYRVPGNRAHVDLLLTRFGEEPDLNINDLDIAVNAVATALKDFFKRLPPLLTQDFMDELEDISVQTDRSCRLLALRALLKKLPPCNFEVLKFIFQHFVRVSENCKLNNMDSKNLAICWWPTLLPYEFSDMGKFELMRPHLEDIVQTMIDQYPFLFCGREEVLMV